MKSDPQILIDKAKAIVVARNTASGRRQCYPPELKKIVRSLVTKHKLSPNRTASLISVSRTAVYSWTSEQAAAKRGPLRPENPLPFRRVSVSGHDGSGRDSALAGITVCLRLLLISQVLLLILLTIQR